MYGKDCNTVGSNASGDGDYYQNEGYYFFMSTSNTYSWNNGGWTYHSAGGWKSCQFRTSVLGSDTIPTSAKAKTFPSVFPSEWKQVMTSVSKYGDNAGKTGIQLLNEYNSRNYTTNSVTATTEYISLLGMYEYFNSSDTGNGNPNEETKSKQYQYYLLGNSTIHYKHSSTTTAVKVYTRSIIWDEAYWAGIGTNGKMFSPESSDSRGISPVFFIG